MSSRCRVSLLVALSLIAGSTMLTPAFAKDGDRCAGSRDVRLVNGKIHTLDGEQFDRIVGDNQGRKVRVSRRRGDPMAAPACA